MHRFAKTLATDYQKAGAHYARRAVVYRYLAVTMKSHVAPGRIAADLSRSTDYQELAARYYRKARRAMGVEL